MNIELGFSCAACGGMCANFANNLVSTFYEQWLSKVEIMKDEKGFLIDIFDSLNLHRMVRGLTPVLLNYGNGLTITNYTDIKYDKNFQPIAANVTVNLTSYSTVNLQGLTSGTTVKALDWKLYKKENKEALKAALTILGLSSAEIVDEPEARFLMVKSDVPIYKCIFFRNNLTDTPSLLHLNKILHNIHQLDNINDRNHKLINAVYFAKTGKKLTPEQANNISITVTKDGFGIVVVEADGTETDLTNGINKQVLAQSLNNWPNIKSEIETWEDKFKLYGGLPSEKLSAQRENIAESLMRTSRVNAAEKTYYKWVKKFLDEYQEYFETTIEYQFDTLISSLILSSGKQMTIDNVSNANKIAINDDALNDETVERVEEDE